MVIVDNSPVDGSDGFPDELVFEAQPGAAGGVELRRQLLDGLAEPTCQTNAEALSYYSMRATQALQFGWELDSDFVESHDWGVCVRFLHDEQAYYSVYVTADHMNRGHLSQWFVDHPDRAFVTSDRCSTMRSYLDYKERDYELMPIDDSPEYTAISMYYKNGRAERSGVRLMNHIDEALFILDQIGAPEIAKKAFCLHPILQMEPDRLPEVSRDIGGGIDQRAVAFAAEYAEVANGYLSSHPKREELMPLGTSDVVKQMLIADKVQNRKDFELYHACSHPRAERLAEYFGEWLAALRVTESSYQRLVADIERKTQFHGVKET